MIDRTHLFINEGDSKNFKIERGADLLADEVTAGELFFFHVFFIV